MDDDEITPAPPLQPPQPSSSSSASSLNKLTHSFTTTTFLESPTVTAMDIGKNNPFVSTQSNSSGLHVALHPLVLLTISDYITRHTLRNQNGPVVGALLGQQNGQEITAEHAFECKVEYDDMEGYRFDLAWFGTRLQQMKDVHKNPPLELVGWYAIISTSGPEQHHCIFQTQLAEFFPEASILLGFQPTTALEDPVGGKLPLTIYESIIDLIETGGLDPEMILNNTKRFKVLFQELPYTIETAEAEMIGIDFVAKGGSNATAVEAPKNPAPSQDPKGKKRAKQSSKEVAASAENHLTQEEEELIASLTAKINAIKMLRARIDLIAKYLEKLPPSYISTGIIPDETKGDYAPVNHIVLRSIQALLGRLALLVPTSSQAFNEELLAEENDVGLVNLLNTMTESIKDARELGRKFAIVERGHSTKKGNSSKRPGSGWENGGQGSSAGDLME